jgi:hypothetical protein
MAQQEQTLSQRDYVDINKALRRLADAQLEIEKAIKAGIECTEEDIRCQQVKADLARRKSVYFPNQP